MINMDISITGVGLDRASRWASVLAFIHCRQLRQHGLKTAFRWFPIYGNSLIDKTARVIEIFGHGLNQGFIDPMGTFMPETISGHVILWTCYSDSFADELIRRGARSVLGWNQKLWFRPIDIPFIIPVLNQIVIDLLTIPPETAIKRFFSTIESDSRLMEVFHNAVFAIKM